MADYNPSSPNYTGFDPTTYRFKPLTGTPSPFAVSQGAPAAAQRQTSMNPLSNFMNSPYAATPVNAPQNTGQNLIGAPAFGYTPAAGGVPQVPNPAQTALQALLGNIGNLGNLGQLSGGIGGINAQLGQQPYQANLPNYQALQGQLSANALANAKGIVDPDILRNLQQGAAERGTSLGIPTNAPNANASYLQALGLTGYGLKNQAQQQFGQLVGLTPTGPQFNPASMLLDPSVLQAAQAAANLYNAAPIPSAAQQAGFNALNAGFGRGQGATQPYGGFPTQSASLVQDVMNKYAPFPGGTPSPAAPFEADPFAYAWQSSKPGDDYADLLNEFFGEGQYNPPPDTGVPYDDNQGGYFQDIDWGDLGLG